MRGEFVGVWPETWREIWLPLIDQEGVPEDIFCELYRELSKALRDPTGENAWILPASDPVQLRQAFDNALVRAGVDVDLPAVDDVYQISNASNLASAAKRREAAEVGLDFLIADQVKTKQVLDAALAELARDPQKRTEAKSRALEGIVNDTNKSREAFEKVSSDDLAGERALVQFLEAAHEALDDLVGDELSNRYFNLLETFIAKFSLRYDLRRPCTLCPTLPGMFTSLVRDLRMITSQDGHLDTLMREFENAVRDLRHDCSDGRIKTCIQKQVNLLEAIGRNHPGVTHNTLGAMCDEVGSWPHATIREALKKLYGFACDYPGIRHAGNPDGVLRNIEMRDMVAMSVLLVGFTPYLSDQLNADVVYRGT